MPQDLTAIDLSKLTWEHGKRAECLAQVYADATNDARSAISWYQASRKPKKWMAMSLRWGAVLLLSASGLIPLIVQVFPVKGAPPLHPLATSFMVAMAAALFGFDKFFNFSTGWMRYVKTDLALRTALDEFEFEWQIARSAWTAPEPTPEQVADMLARARTFATKVNTIVTEETNVWITEFQASLAQLGESVQAAEARVQADAAKRAEAAKTGALNLTVKHDGKIWAGPIKLQVGKEGSQDVSGPTVALTELPVGPRRLAAEVFVGGKLYRGEIAVDVVAGQTSRALLDVVAFEAPAPPAE